MISKYQFRIKQDTQTNLITYYATDYFLVECGSQKYLKFDSHAAEEVRTIISQVQ